MPFFLPEDAAHLRNERASHGWLRKVPPIQQAASTQLAISSGSEAKQG
jgi:hypothetical protein